MKRGSRSKVGETDLVGCGMVCCVVLWCGFRLSDTFIQKGVNRRGGRRNARKVAHDKKTKRKRGLADGRAGERNQETRSRQRIELHDMGWHRMARHGGGALRELGCLQLLTHVVILLVGADDAVDPVQNLGNRRSPPPMPSDHLFCLQLSDVRTSEVKR